MKSQRNRKRKLLVGVMSAQLIFGMMPAAYAQIASTVAQPAPTNVVVNAGTATGAANAAGSVTVLNPTALNGSLSVQSGSTYVIDFSKAGSVTLPGNFTNAGTIYAVSTNPAVTQASITAANIFNQQGALLSTILPSSGIPGFTSLLTNLNLNLTAINNIVNFGTISSAGSLNLSAGNSIINQLPATMTGPSPAIMAMQNLNMQAASIINSGVLASQLASVNAYTASLVNSGAMQALNQINIQNLIGNTLNVNNLNGIISAGQSINFSTLGSVYDSKNSLISQALLQISGGALRAPLVSLTSPGGKLSVAVDQITGAVNLSGASAMVDVSGGGLSIANAALSADPIFAANGVLDLSGLFASGPQFATYGGDFIALSTSDIIAPLAPTGANINAQAQSGAGGRIFIDAGTNYSVANYGCTNCLAGTDYALGSPSASGGSIVLPGVGLTTNNNSVTLLAHAGRLGPETPTFAGGSENGNRGSISIGNILVCCNKEGQYTTSASGLPDPPINIIAPGNITLNSITNATGSINVLSSLGNVSVLSNQTIEGFRGNVSLTAHRDLSLGEKVTIDAVGANLSLTAQDGSLTTLAGDNISAFPGYAGGGKLSLSSGNNMSVGAANNLYGGAGIDLDSSYGGIKTGEGSTLQTCKGDIALNAGLGDISVGYSNTMSAKGGDIIISGCGSISTGEDDVFNAWKGSSQGGNISLDSLFGSVSIGPGNNFNADGGNVGIYGQSGVTVKSETTVNAFHETGSGGSVSLKALPGDIQLYAHSVVNAVGGDLSLNSYGGKVITGSYDKLSAFKDPDTGSGGALTISASRGVSISDHNNLVAGKGIDLSSSFGSISTGTESTFLACCNGIALNADRGSVSIGATNTMNAVGGDIRLSGATGVAIADSPDASTFNAFKAGSAGGNVSLASSAGSVVVGGNSNVNATGGNVTVTAQKDLTTHSLVLINAFRRNGTGGSLTLSSAAGNLALGSANTFNAVGGNITVTSTSGTLRIGSNDELNAFDSGNTAAGNILLKSKGDLLLPGYADLNAVGGNISLESTSGKVDIEVYGNLRTFNPVVEGNGNISINAHNNLVISLSELGADNNITLSSKAMDVSLVQDTIAAGGNDSAGNLVVSSLKGNITLDLSNQVFAYGSITMNAAKNLTLGSLLSGNNCLCTINGNINLSGAAVSLGLHDSIQSNNGAVTLTANQGSLTLGQHDLLQAGGGNLSLISSKGNIDLGSYNELDAFYKLSNPAVGGSVYLTASAGTVLLGSNNLVNAVGGDIHITSAHFDPGTNNILCTFCGTQSQSQYSIHMGDVLISSPGDLVLTDQSLTVRGNLTLSGATITLSGDTYIAFGGDLKVTSTSGDVVIDVNNVLAAFNTVWVPGYVGPATGGNVFIRSANDIKFGEAAGGIGNESLPNEPASNVVQAVDGNIVMSAARGFEAKFDNVFIASTLLPHCCASTGGGIYIFTGGADLNPLPTPNPGYNVFDFSDKHVNIDPNPPSFSPATTVAGISIHQESKSGGDDSTIDLAGGSAISLYSGNSLVHILSSDLSVNGGIIYMATGDAKSDKFTIQFKDSSASAGCVPIIIPPPPICVVPPRPNCQAPTLICKLPLAPTAPEAPKCPTPTVKPPEPPACKIPPAPPVCPPAPVPPPPPPPPIPPTSAGSAAGASTSHLVGTVQLPAFVQVGNQCTGYFIQSAPDSYLQSTAGTKMAVSGPNAVAIANGQAVVKAGANELTVQSGNTEVVLQSQSIAVINSKPGEMMTVTSLADANPDGVDVKVDSQSYHIKPGEQLLIGKVTQTDLEGTLPESQTNLAGGAHESSLTLKGGVTKQNPVYVLKAAVDLPDYLPKLGIMQQCHECAFASYLANKATQPAPGEADLGVLPPADKSESMSLSAGHDQAQPKSEFKPVAYMSGIMPRNIITSANAELVSLAPDHYQLHRGSALVQAKRTTRVDTDLLSVIAKPGSVLLLTDSRQLSRVRALTDRHVGDVQILIGKNIVQLSPGRELAVSLLDGDPIPKVYADGMARRNMHVQTVGKFKIVTDEFSILNALMKHPLLYQLRQSSDVLETRTLSDIMKVTAALSLMSDRYKGPYFGPEVRSGTGIADKPIDPIY